MNLTSMLLFISAVVSIVSSIRFRSKLSGDIINENEAMMDKGALSSSFANTTMEDEDELSSSSTRCSEDTTAAAGITNDYSGDMAKCVGDGIFLDKTNSPAFAGQGDDLLNEVGQVAVASAEHKSDKALKNQIVCRKECCSGQAKFRPNHRAVRLFFECFDPNAGRGLNEECVQRANPPTEAKPRAKALGSLCGKGLKCKCESNAGSRSCTCQSNRWR